ncbi:MAG TPA: RNA-directed DNA polymerase [Candidatus Gastranaerophilales bacterium]|nr:RNA-directed DNA polymerase [Candidatus Gastranaerophilales bacterium]
MNLLNLFNAYFDCRRNKRNTINALAFEFELEKNLMELYEQLKNGTYKIGRSISFVVTKPRPREVWAADFRDRIVHHLVYNAIKERFYKRFIYDSYSCIPEKGTLAACKRLQRFARSATQNYTKKAYYLKADIANFFMSIDKSILFGELKRYVHEDWVLNLLEQIIYHDPRKNVFLKSPPQLFRLIPYNKSLWNTPSSYGLPIGNLTSQFFSNVYLNILDQFVKHELKCRHYCRYVDDFVLLHDSPQQLNEWYNKINEFTKNRLKLKLHPYKKAINTVFSGIDFVGFIVKPNRIYLRKLTIKRAFRSVKDWQSNSARFNTDTLKSFRSTINSYLGMLRQAKGYKIRIDLCNLVNNLFIQPDINFSKLVLVNYGVF